MRVRLKDWDRHWEKPGKGRDGVGAVSGAHVEQGSSCPGAHFPHPSEDKWDLLVVIV